MNRSRSALAVPLVSVGLLFLACGVVLAQSNAAPPPKKSSEVFKNIQVLKDTPASELFSTMQFISGSLGIQCEYCHVGNQFEKDDKKTKQFARKMIDMQFAINKFNFDGEQEVTCFSCHRGRPIPKGIPAVAESAVHPLSEPEPEMHDNPPDLPHAQEIVQKYVNAIGGAAAISKAATIEEKGTTELGGRQLPVRILKRNPDKMAIITHLPPGDSTTATDGSSGWSSFPGHPARMMNSAEVDAMRLDADLQLPLELSKTCAELAVLKKVAVAGNDSILLACRRSGVPPLELYFDAQSGLLVRTVHYSPTALGLNPTQTDYSDYRDAGGLKVPFQWTSATPMGRSTTHIESAKLNADVGDEAFSKPAVPPPPPEAQK